MENIGKLLLFTGVVSLVLGFLFLNLGKIPFIGRLPGDIIYKGKNFSFYFPLATSIGISLILSLVLYIVRRFF